MNRFIVTRQTPGPAGSLNQDWKIIDTTNGRRVSVRPDNNTHDEWHELAAFLNSLVAP